MSKANKYTYGIHTLQDLIDFKNEYMPNVPASKVKIQLGDFEGNYTHRKIELYMKGRTIIDIGFELHDECDEW